MQNGASASAVPSNSAAVIKPIATSSNFAYAPLQSLLVCSAPYPLVGISLRIVLLVAASTLHGAVLVGICPAIALGIWDHIEGYGKVMLACHILCSV